MAEGTAGVHGIAGRLKAELRLLRLELRRSTGGKALYLVAGCLVWFAIVALWNALAAEQPMEGTSVLNGIVALPTVLLALFLGSQIFSADQDNRSLEIVLSLPRGRRALWFLRLGVAVGFSWAVAILLAGLSWLFVAGFRLPTFWLHSLWPLMFFGSLAFALSVAFRSGTAAALVCSLLLVFMFLTHEGWKGGGSLFYLWPFLNPLLPPEGVLPEVWQREVLANRLLVAGLAAALAMGGIWGMRRRERLL